MNRIDNIGLVAKVRKMKEPSGYQDAELSWQRKHKSQGPEAAGERLAQGRNSKAASGAEMGVGGRRHEVSQ